MGEGSSIFGIARIAIRRYVQVGSRRRVGRFPRAGFDIARFKPRLVCIEARPEVRQTILDYQHDYMIIGKYLRADPRKLYFTSADRRERWMTEAVTR